MKTDYILTILFKFHLNFFNESENCDGKINSQKMYIRNNIASLQSNLNKTNI